MNNIVSRHITSSIENINKNKIINEYNDDKVYLGKFIMYIMNRVDNSSIKTNIIRNNIISNFIKESKVNTIKRNNSIIIELNDIIKECKSNQYNMDIFIEKVKDINNIDLFIDNIKTRVEDQIIDTVNQNKLYKSKVENIIKNIENKVLDKEIEESYKVRKINLAKNELNNTHKQTLLNIIAQKLSEHAFKTNDFNYIINESSLNLDNIYEDSKELYTMFEIFNSLNMEDNFLKYIL